jgi:hypothetical protein
MAMPGLTPDYAHEAITKMGGTVVPQPTHRPDMAPSDYHLFGLVEDALHGYILLMKMNRNKIFVTCSEAKQGILQHWYTASCSTLAKVC